jgi:hypothetical protein
VGRRLSRSSSHEALAWSDTAVVIKWRSNSCFMNYRHYLCMECSRLITGTAGGHWGRRLSDALVEPHRQQAVQSYIH